MPGLNRRASGQYLEHGPEPSVDCGRAVIDRCPLSGTGR